MGVTNLLKLIREKAPNAIKEVSTRELSGWRIGMDTSIFIYQWGTVGTTRNIVGQDIDGVTRPINHLQGLLSRTVKILDLGAIPVYIFDGKPPQIKAGVIAARKELAEKGQRVEFSNIAFEECKELAKLMGVTVIQAPSEAEAQAAVLTKISDLHHEPILDAVATNDIDAITFGAKYMIKGLDSSSLSRKSGTVTVIDLEEVLKSLKLTQAMLIDLSILLGSDYTDETLKDNRKRSYSWKKLYQLICKYGTIEKILAAEQIIPPLKFTFLEARREFTYPHVNTAMVLSIDVKKLSDDEILKISKYLTDRGVLANKIVKSLNFLKNFNGLSY
jgi:flap endonuclease-1